MEKKQTKKTIKKHLKNVDKIVDKKETKRKNIIELGKKIIIPVYKLEEKENDVLVKINYDKDYPNYCTHVWIHKTNFLHYKDKYYIEGEVIKIFSKDTELKFKDSNNEFSLLFRNNMIESEI